MLDHSGSSGYAVALRNVQHDLLRDQGRRVLLARRLGERRRRPRPDGQTPGAHPNGRFKAPLTTRGRPPRRRTRRIGGSGRLTVGGGEEIAGAPSRRRRPHRTASGRPPRLRSRALQPASCPRPPSARFSRAVDQTRTRRIGRSGRMTVGGGEEIRTPEGLHPGGFQDRCLRPLGHPSTATEYGRAAATSRIAEEAANPAALHYTAPA